MNRVHFSIWGAAAVIVAALVSHAEATRRGSPTEAALVAEFYELRARIAALEKSQAKMQQTLQSIDEHHTREASRQAVERITR